MKEGSKFTVVELWTTLDKIKQRKVVRDAKAQAAEARAYAHEDIKAQSTTAKTRANKGRAQETKAGAKELNTGGNKSKSEIDIKIETTRAPPQAKCRAHTLKASATFHSEQLGHYDKELSTAVVEKKLLDGRIADIKRSIAEIGWKSDVRSAEVARNLERNVRARTIIIESSPCSPAGELETQKKMQQSLASPLPRLSFEFQSLSVDRITFSLTEGGFWDGLWGEHEKVALIQRHEDFGSWYGFKAHPLHSLDFTPSFLAHATLYALGQYTQIPLLRVNAFRALQVVLKSVHPMPPHSLAARGFAVLVQYVYTHVAAEEPLRELVASFAAWNHTTLLLEQEYRWVMEGGGDFVLDLTELLARRLAV